MKRVLLPLLLSILMLSCAPPSYRVKKIPPPTPEVFYPPPKDTFLYEEGKRAFEQENFSAALEKLDRFIKENPTSDLTDDALFLMGQIFLKRENPYEALRYFEKIEKNFPGSNTYEEALYGQAFCWYRLKDYRRAKAKLMLLSRLELPDSLYIRVQTLKGHLCVMDKDTFCGIQAYLDAQSRSKNPMEKAMLDGFIVKVVFKMEDLKTLEELMQAYPQALPGQAAKIKLAEILARQKQYEAAKNLLTPSLLETLPKILRHKVTSLLTSLKRAFMKKVVVGCLLPLSGDRAPFGLRALKGALLAAGAFQPNPKDLEITLVVKDTKGSPETAAEMARALAETSHVQAIIGPMFFNTTQAAARELQERAIPLISLSQAEGIPNLGSHVFRNCLTPQQQVQTLVDYLIRGLNIHKAAILYPNTPFGMRYLKRFWEAFEKSGGEIRGAESYLPSDTDFGTPIKKLVGLYDIKERWERGDIPSDKNGKFDPVIDFEALFIPDVYTRVVLIAPQLAFHDVLGVTLAGINTWNAPELVKEGKQFVRGAIFTDGFSPQNSSPEVKRFVNDFRAIFDETPEILAAQAFDAIKILVHTFHRYPLSDIHDIQEKLKEDTGFHGVSGLRYFDANGEALREVLVLTVTRRGIQPLPSLIPSSP